MLNTESEFPHAGSFALLRSHRRRVRIIQRLPDGRARISADEVNLRARGGGFRIVHAQALTMTVDLSDLSPLAAPARQPFMIGAAA